MKEVKFYSLPLVALAIMVAGCTRSEDVTSEGKGSDSNVTYAIAHQGAGASSRLAYEDGDIMKVTWSANDAFSVFVSSSTQTPQKFSIVAPSSGSYTAKEMFKCDDFKADDGQAIDAIYPALPDGQYNPYRLELDLSAQTQDGNGDTKHLAVKDYIIGHATYKAGNDVDFDFTDSGNANSGRIGGILRINITFTSKVSKVNAITVKTADNTLNTKALVNLVGNTSVVYGTPQEIKLTVENGSVGTDNIFKAFVMAFPSDISSNIDVKVETNAGVFSKSFTPSTHIILERGKRNTIPMDMSSVTPDVSSLTAYNAVGSGTAEDPYLLYTEAQLEDWAKQNNSGSIEVKRVSLGRSRVNAAAHFKLANNIALTDPSSNDESNWTPIGTDSNPFNGTFDGGGHSITNMQIKNSVVYAGFIGKMTGGEIKNITVGGEINVTKTSVSEKTFAGGLVASMNGGTLSGTLKSDVAVTVSSNASIYAGGLVGAKATGATVGSGAALTATGDVTVTVSGTPASDTEVGAGTVIGNGTADENTVTGGGTAPTVNNNTGTNIITVTNGASNKFDAGFTLNPWGATTDINGKVD